MKNLIHWGQKVSVKPQGDEQAQSSWYDHGFFEVPFEGEANIGRMQAAIQKKVNVPSFGKFGGGRSLGKVELARPGVLRVEMIYHIGD